MGTKKSIDAQNYQWFWLRIHKDLIVQNKSPTYYIVIVSRIKEYENKLS